MIASRTVLAAGAASLCCVADVRAQDAATPRRDPVERKVGRSDLYQPSPTLRSEGVAAGFYDAYGTQLTRAELRSGVPLGAFATAPLPPAATEQRAGFGSQGAVRAAIVAGLVALLAAAALLLAPTSARAASLPRDFLGISTEDVYTGDEAYATRELARQRDAGFRLARQVFRWDEIEPKDGEYDFSAVDRFVGRAARAGIRVMPLLQGEPSWATSRPSSKQDVRALFPPKRVSHYERFANVIAARFGRGGDFWRENPSVPAVPVTSYQLWNEPNFPSYWGMRPSARAYGKLLRAGAKGIHLVDRRATIVSAGLPDSKIGQSPATFLRTLLRSKATRGAVDAIAIHPYDGSPKRVVRRVREMRRTIDRAGGRRIGMWITEIGWATGGPKTKGRTVRESQQGRYLVTTVRSLARQRRSLRLRGIVYFAWRDSGRYPGVRDFWGLHTGLVDLSGSDKRGLATVKRGLGRS